jgi:hypothetical protein
VGYQPDSGLGHDARGLALGLWRFFDLDSLPSLLILSRSLVVTEGSILDSRGSVLVGCLGQVGDDACQFFGRGCG